MKTFTICTRADDADSTGPIQSAFGYVQTRVHGGVSTDALMEEIAAIASAFMGLGEGDEEREFIAETFREVTEAALSIGSVLDEFDAEFPDTQQKRMI